MSLADRLVWGHSRPDRFVRANGEARFIPDDRFHLIASPPKRGLVLSLPVTGRPEVDGVELWLDCPHAEGLLARLGRGSAPV